MRALRQTLLEEEKGDFGEDAGHLEDDDNVDDAVSGASEEPPKSSEEEDKKERSSNRKKNRKKKKNVITSIEDSEAVLLHPDSNPEDSVSPSVPKKTKKKKNRSNAKAASIPVDTEEVQPTSESIEPEEAVKKASKKSTKADKTKEADGDGSSAGELKCAVCSSVFPSKNKLFEHLKATNHAVYVGKASVTTDNDKRKKKGKKATGWEKYNVVA